MTPIELMNLLLTYQNIIKQNSVPENNSIKSKYVVWFPEVLK